MNWRAIRLTQRLRCALGGLLFMSVGGCSPAIYSFEAKPNRICRGDAVTLSWNASKAGVITLGPAPGAVQAQGSTQVATGGRVTRYHFEVSGLFGSAARDVDVELADRQTAPLGQSIADPSATCNGSTLAVTASAPPALVSSNLKVGVVAALAEDKHKYHIDHAGKSADLEPGASTNAFEGLAMTGDWKLSLTLLAEEQCGTPSVPQILGVQVSTSCTTGG